MWAFAYTVNVHERKMRMKLKIVIAFGGTSVEHEISILSAHQVMHAISLAQYEIIPLYIAKDGLMYTGNCLFALENFKDLDMLCDMAECCHMIRRGQACYLTKATHKLFSKDIAFDMVFPVLHGTNGEDGAFQGFLKTLQVPYVGCSVLGGAIGQDKVIMKQLLQMQGIPMTPWFSTSISQRIDISIFDRAKSLGYPLIVKPANLGSSIGICVVNDEKELHKAMLEAYQYDRKLVIEKVVEHMKEINCSVLGSDEGSRASVLEEVSKQDAILSYNDKYVGTNKTKGMANAARIIPANLEEDLTNTIQDYAMKTFAILNATGVSRVDFLLNEETQEVFVNEINTIPGSLSFYLWEKSGISFDQLIDELIQIARNQYRQEKQRIYTYTTNILQTYQQGTKGTK